MTNNKKLDEFRKLNELCDSKTCPECNDRIEDWQTGYNAAQKEAEGLKKSLVDWLKFEDKEIEENGPYVGKKINELINQAREALKKYESGE